MSLKTRLLYLSFAWLTTGVIYFATGGIKGNLWIIPETSIDSLIPFSPNGIWLYLLFYAYIPFTFLTANHSKIKLLSVTFIITAFISGIVFFFIPSSMIYPNFNVDGISSTVLNFISVNDTPQNCIPSMHGSLITLCTFANWNKSNKIRSFLCVVLVLCMYYSIIQVRRHLFVDLSAGILLAGVVWGMTYGLLKSRDLPRKL